MQVSPQPQGHTARRGTGLPGPSQHHRDDNTNRTPRLHIWSVFVVQLRGDLQLPRGAGGPPPRVTVSGSGRGRGRSGGRRGAEREGEGDAAERPSADRWPAAGPHPILAWECIIQAARSGASFSSQASGASVSGGPPPRPTPPSRHRLRSGSEWWTGMALSHRQRCPLHLATLDPRLERQPGQEASSVKLINRGRWGGPPLQSETSCPSPDLVYTTCTPTGANISAEWTCLAAPASPYNLRLGPNHHQSKLCIRSHWPKKPSVGNMESQVLEIGSNIAQEY